MKKNGFVISIVALSLSVISVGALAVVAMRGNLNVNPDKVYTTTIDTMAQETTKGIQKAQPKAANVENSKTTEQIKKTAVEETKPAETKPVETKPAETKPAETKPAETKPAATKPAQEKAPASDKDKVIEAARKAVEACTNSSMTKEQKLKAAFDYIKKNYLEGVRRDLYKEMDWPVVYAKDLLIGGKGDCFSYGAAFAYMAKVIGYENVYACSSGGHGWAEIDGKIYDPEWSMHTPTYSYFGMSYDEKCDVAYKGAIGWAEWTHVKV